jgi:hypothetical protein
VTHDAKVELEQVQVVAMVELPVAAAVVVVVEAALTEVWVVVLVVRG